MDRRMLLTITMTAAQVQVIGDRAVLLEVYDGQIDAIFQNSLERQCQCCFSLGTRGHSCHVSTLWPNACHY